MESSPPRDTGWSWSEKKTDKQVKEQARRELMLWNAYGIELCLVKFGLECKLEGLDDATVRAQMDYAKRYKDNSIVVYAFALYYACNGHKPSGLMEPPYFWLAATRSALLEAEITEDAQVFDWSPLEFLKSGHLFRDIQHLRYLQEVELPKEKALAVRNAHYGLVCEFATMALLVKEWLVDGGPLTPRHYRIAWIVNYHESEETPLDYAETLDLYIPYGEGFDTVKTQWVHPGPELE